jgi:RimJ/RimL family protein N-acetyltransferase
MTAPLLTTARLDLCQPQAADLTGLAALLEPDAVRRFLGNRLPDLSDTYARLARNAGSWALYGYGNFVVRERGQPAVVGNCGIFHSWRGFDGFDDVAEAGWIFAEPVWGRGYATEAAGAALAWFDRVHGPRRIVCMIDPANHASHAVAARLGFVAYGEQEYEGHAVTLLHRGGDGAGLPTR